MRYRLSCLTPVLVGDGSSLSPIDYMVWKNHVNVLDQKRIFRLLAKGPRLDGYLSQIRRADKLDFASWGGFAQNFAGRRIPFEDPAYAVYWERLRAESLNIPTFASGVAGPFLPGSALKGALRTAVVAAQDGEKALDALASRLPEDRPPRRLGEHVEQQLLGKSGHDPLRTFAISDSGPVPASVMKIYLLRTATLIARGAPSGPGASPYALGWKTSPRGTVDARRMEESTPTFAEMAPPGTVFEGSCTERAFLQSPEAAKALRWRRGLDCRALVEAVNRFAGELLAVHREFAQWTGLSLLAAGLEELQARLRQLQEREAACLLNIGWGGGVLGKSAWCQRGSDAYRRLLGAHPLYGKAIRTGFPLPKTRRVVFTQNQPSALPGWAMLEFE